LTTPFKFPTIQSEMLFQLPFLADTMKFALLLSSLLIFLLQTSCIFDSFKNEITVYPVLEDKEYGLIPLYRTIYKVFPELQTVIYWFPGIMEVPDKLANCTVRDRLNWKCEYPDASAKLIMNDGEFQEIPLHKSDLDTRYKYVSWWKWWMVQVKGIIK